ncbi:MAG: oxidoreductase [Halomonas sp.]|nr:oxidoreductase [Halomonas sp.]MDN6297810.1 oxidoreductase [Halomonas sp.]MDN6336474.1 oxidoreductase [Halomonas sp.]
MSQVQITPASLPIKVGLVGYGMAGRTFHAPLIQASPELELTAVVSRHAERILSDLPGVEVLSRLEYLLERHDIDLIVIATPNEAHFANAGAALDAGKHVVVDKPFTLTLAEARQLKTQANAARRLLSVFHNRRWDSDFLTLKAMLEAKTLGRVVSLESRFDRFRPHVTDQWRDQSQPGAGIWYDLGPHLLDQARALFGMPREILLDLTNMRDGAEVSDYFCVLLKYDRLRISLSASSLAAESTPRFRVHGTRGSYVTYGLDPQEAWLKQGHTPTPQWGVDPSPGSLCLDEKQDKLIDRAVAPVPGDYCAFYSGIAATLQKKAPPPVTADEAIEVMLLLEKGLDSDSQGRWVKLKA